MLPLFTLGGFLVAAAAATIHFGSNVGFPVPNFFGPALPFMNVFGPTLFVLGVIALKHHWAGLVISGGSLAGAVIVLAGIPTTSTYPSWLEPQVYPVGVASMMIAIATAFRMNGK
ncbi:hypothetical protein A3A39_02915 [Candidatus Kaiserbacteria bacterium RIFCSPLOWO2_01_FULL_54_13]|uniref:Uncharacterized protein n=1 Tax=Candidatus Kaiserbacteria bacterium RIFCSPLOWO2_01_FULL_54_13 TaxID=1798512 RepID=A0A1F6F2V9_9BACT|nr:MAG: hypothetical protein A3A39_02915 [Candidatus Kaiserbacteria bacterium RIFCSPLOWO2_01_FULL_54_13]